MKRIAALIIFCSLISMSSVFSQGESHFAIQYDISFGMGDLGDYISAPSFRGASMQYRYAVTDNVLVGADLAWNVFYEKKDYDSYTQGTMTLSGIQYRYQNEVPLLVQADYVIMPDNDFQPYVGLGLGTIYCERITDMGIWRLTQDPWQFAIKPELGMLYKTSGGSAVKVALKYYVGFETADLDTQGYLTLSLGMAF